MEKLIETIKKFRSEKPDAGSARMVEMIDNIICEYWAVLDVKLSQDGPERSKQIFVLYQIKELNRHVRNGDYIRASRANILNDEWITL
jgi:hypothetical protein